MVTCSEKTLIAYSDISPEEKMALHEEALHLHQPLKFGKVQITQHFKGKGVLICDGTVRNWINPRRCRKTKFSIPWSKIPASKVERKFIEAYQNGHSYSEMEKELNVSHISYWVKKFKLPLRSSWQFSSTSELSYLLGVMYGDGWLSHTHCYTIGLNAKDRDFVEKFRDVLFKICGKTQNISIHNGCFRAHVYSKDLFGYLSSPLKKHKPLITTFPCEFIRGFFDSEGTAHKSRNAVRDVTIKAVNTNLEIILFIRFLLNTLNIQSTLSSSKYLAEHGRVKTIWRIDVSPYESKIHYWKLIGFSIRRKQKVLDDTFTSPPKYKCKKCGKTFDVPNALGSHTHIVHNDPLHNKKANWKRWHPNEPFMEVAN